MVRFNQILEKNSVCLFFEESRPFKRHGKERREEGERKGSRKRSTESWGWEIVWK